MKLIFKHETACGGNHSEAVKYSINEQEASILVENDRKLRATASGEQLSRVPTRSPQAILNELWNKEEASAHQSYRSDRKCGNNISLSSLQAIGKDPSRPEDSPENILLAKEDFMEHTEQIALLRTAVSHLHGRSRQVMQLILSGESQVDIAEQLHISKPRVSQLYRQAKESIRKEFTETAK